MAMVHLLSSLVFYAVSRSPARLVIIFPAEVIPAR